MKLGVQKMKYQEALNKMQQKVDKGLRGVGGGLFGMEDTKLPFISNESQDPHLSGRLQYSFAVSVRVDDMKAPAPPRGVAAANSKKNDAGDFMPPDRSQGGSGDSKERSVTDVELKRVMQDIQFYVGSDYDELKETADHELRAKLGAGDEMVEVVNKVL